METARIKLKFKPVFIKEIQSYPNCNLEIIPEVTCVSNIEKINWMKNNTIEYVVPMIYKIVLKRQNTPSRHGIKVYHSCVDLLSPSITPIDFISNDVPRIISDHFILRKQNSLLNILFNENTDCISDENNDIDQLSTKKESSQSQEIKSTISKCVSTNGKLEDKLIQCSKTLLNDCTFYIENKANDNKDNVIEYGKSTSVCNQTDIGQNTSYVLLNDKCKECLSTKIISNVYIQSPDLIGTYINAAIEHKFFVSPVFKLNTKQDSLRETTQSTTDPINSARNLSKFIFHSKNIRDIKSKPQSIPSYSFNNNCKLRVTPEERVAVYVKEIEKEVLPLKVILYNIFKKCASLGLNEIVTKNTNYENLIPSKSFKNEFLSVNCIPKSNRVVYSFVSEG